MNFRESTQPHRFEPEIVRRDKRNKDARRLNSLLWANNKYDDIIRRLSPDERNRHQKRTEAYLRFIKRAYWTDFTKDLEPEVTVSYGESAFFSLRVEGVRYSGRPRLQFGLIRPEHISTQEEFLHAYESWSRREDWFLKPRGFAGNGNDFRLSELISGMTHCACFVDQSLTLGALRLGKLEYLREYAQTVTVRDAKKIQPFRHYKGIMGGILNERFQYSPVPLELLGEGLKTLEDDLEVYLNRIDSIGNQYPRFEMTEALQLLSLSYGENFLSLLFDLLDSTDANGAVDKAVRWIERDLAKGDSAVDNLVRHQVPLSRQLENEDLSFPVGDEFFSFLSPDIRGTGHGTLPVPTEVCLTDFSSAVIGRRRARVCRQN